MWRSQPTSENVQHLGDIAEDLKGALGFVSSHSIKAEIEVREKLKQMRVLPFGLYNGPVEIVTIDSSYAPIFRTSNLWIVAVRAVAIRCKYDDSEGYVVNECIVNEGGHLLTTDRNLAAEIGDLAAEIQALTSKRPGEAPKRMASLVRIYRELELAAKVSERFSGLTVVLDGTLTAPPLKPVKSKLDETVRSCMTNNNDLVGISKDSSLNLFGSTMIDEEILQHLPNGELVYVVPPQPQKTALGPKGTTFYVKYHPDAPKWFRTDVASPGTNPGALFSRLSAFARSQVCPGYLYPLVEAHKASVALRKYPGLYDKLLYKVGDELGLDPAQITWGRTNVDGRRRDAFHAYLDLISRRSVGS